MILEILSYRLSLREGGSFFADDEAISLPGKVGDCFGKERLAMTLGLGEFQNSFDDLLSFICGGNLYYRWTGQDFRTSQAAAANASNPRPSNTMKRMIEARNISE